MAIILHHSNHDVLQTIFKQITLYVNREDMQAFMQDLISKFKKCGF